jgi:hypothetical protein
LGPDESRVQLGVSARISAHSLSGVRAEFINGLKSGADHGSPAPKYHLGTQGTTSPTDSPLREWQSSGTYFNRCNYLAVSQPSRHTPKFH